MGNSIEFKSKVKVPGIVDSLLVDADITAQRFNCESEGGEFIAGNANINSDGIAIGQNAISYNQGDIAVGNNSSANSGKGIAIGNEAIVQPEGSIAIGANTSSNKTNAIAIGNSAIADAENAIQIGVGTNNTANSLQIGKNNIYDIENNEIHLNGVPQQWSLSWTAVSSLETGAGYCIVNTNILKSFAVLNNIVFIYDINDTQYPTSAEIFTDETTDYYRIKVYIDDEADNVSGYIIYTPDNHFTASANGVVSKNIQAQTIETNTLSLLSKYPQKTTAEQQDLETIIQLIDHDKVSYDSIKERTYTSITLACSNIIRKSFTQKRTVFIQINDTEYVYIQGILLKDSADENIHYIKGCGLWDNSNLTRTVTKLRILLDQDSSSYILYYITNSTYSTQIKTAKSITVSYS